MRLAGHVAVMAVAGLLLCTPVWAEDAAVTIVDELGAQQEDELIAVYGDGRLLGTLHVGPAHPFDSFETSVPVGTLEYTLCGQLQRRETDGRLTTRRIDNGGRVPVRPGDKLRAYTLFDILFGLEAPGVLVDVTHGPACDPAVS